MKPWHKKSISLLLLAAILTASSAVFSACGDSASSEESNTVSIPPVKSESAPEDLFPYQEGTYDGASFDFMIVRTGYAGQDYDDIWVEEDSAEGLSAAVYNRNLQVEERHDITIHAEAFGNPTGEIPNLVMAGDSTYDAIQEKLVNMMGTLVIQGYLHNIRDIDTLYLEAPWYDNNVMNSASIAGQVYFFGGDIEVSDKMGLAVIAFNKKLAIDHQLPDLYETVKNGEWTLDLLHTFSSAGTVDINGDGKLTKEDQWGLIAEDFFGWVFLISNGNLIAEKDDEDIPYLTVYSEKAVNDLEAIMNLMYDDTARAGHDFNAEDYTNVFSENRALFHANVLSSITLLREMESDFGIIPLPKYDVFQTDYQTTFSPWVARYIAVPSSNTELDMTGVILDAMSRSGGVADAYYDVVLTGRTIRDGESSAMLDIIFDSVVCDIGACYNWNNVWFMYQSFFSSGSRNFASKWQSIENGAQAGMESTIEYYQTAIAPVQTTEGE